MTMSLKVSRILALAILAATVALPVAAAEESVKAAASDAAVGTKLTIPASVQASAEVGVVVRVKEITVAEDVTLVTISASYSGTTDTLRLAWGHSPTYLEDENGQRFPLQRPDDNPWLDIENNKTMQGRLVFIGRISPESKKVKLVFNDGNEGDTHLGPGMTLTIPLS